MCTLVAVLDEGDEFPGDAGVGVVDDGRCPVPDPFVCVGAHLKLIGRVGLQVLDDRGAAGAGLVLPLPVRIRPRGGGLRGLRGGFWSGLSSGVLLTVPDGVLPEK